MRVDLLITADILAVANKAAAVFDYDVGGAQTFGNCPLYTDGKLTHYFASTLINPDYLPAFESPQTMFAALGQLALRYDREPLTLSECERVYAGLVMAESIDVGAMGLERIDMIDEVI